jgi:hypothetical protein
LTLTAGDRFLEVFNATSGKVVPGRRDVTNVPARALMLMNGAPARNQADVGARRPTAQHDASDAAPLHTRGRSAEALWLVSNTLNAIFICLKAAFVLVEFSKL